MADFKYRALVLCALFTVFFPVSLWLLYLSGLTHEWGEEKTPAWAKRIVTRTSLLLGIVTFVMVVVRIALFPDTI